MALKRDSKGRFLKRGKKRKSTKKRTKRSKIGAAKRKGRKVMAKKKRRRSTKGASITSIGTKAKVAAAGAAYGYAKEQTKWLRDAGGKPYQVDAVGQDATFMVGAHLMAAHGPRVTRKAFDYLALALAGHNGVKFGQSGFKMSGEDEEDLVGDVDPADFEEGDGDPELEAAADELDAAAADVE